MVNSGICKINGKKDFLAKVIKEDNKIVATIKKKDLPVDKCFLDFCPSNRGKACSLY